MCINHRDICNAHPSRSLGAGDERGGEEVIEYIQIYVDMSRFGSFYGWKGRIKFHRIKSDLSPKKTIFFIVEIV